MKQYHLLIINPGSTSTKIAFFQDNKKIFQTTIRHSAEELSHFPNTISQSNLRKKVIIDTLAEAGINLEKLNAVVGRGGLLRPIEGGTYRVNEKMLLDLRAEKRGSHASNLGAILADEIAANYRIPAFVVDPVCVDEMEPLARLSGVAEISRESLFHALNQKAIGRRAASDLGKDYGTVKLIVAHLGGGISVGTHHQGRVIDVNNAIPGDGPYSPERSGGVPAGALVELCFSGLYSKKEVQKKLVGGGGLVSYLGTNDAVEVENRINKGDERTRLVYEGLAYQVAKEIGAAATVLKGRVDAVVITGGMANSPILVNWIKERVQFIAPVHIYPGEDEMEALAAGGLRVLLGQEEPKVY